MKFRICILLFLLTIQEGAFSQTPKPSRIPPPEDPVLATMPSESAWTLEARQLAPAFKPQNAEQEAALQLIYQFNPRISRIEVSKSANWWRQMRTTDDGRALVSWAARSLLFYQVANDPTGEVAVASSPEVMASMRVGPADFPELAWVNSKNFAGPVLFEGKACWHFRDAGNAPAGEEVPVYARTSTGAESAASEGADTTVGREAWVDAKTRLPVAYRDGDVQFLYRYESRKPEAMSPSPEFIQVIRRYIK